MTRQKASTLISVPLLELHRELRAVERWSGFLEGVTEVVKTSHERYLFRFDDGSQARVVVRAHPRERLFTWRALTGPRFEGAMRLARHDDRHTRVTLAMTFQPSGFLANLAEMVATSTARATVDLHRLEAQVVASLPHPPRPGESVA